jgi:DNA-binding transcriptional ArsR family regulator
MFRETLTSLKGPDMQVELDKKSLFALASDTRLEILRALQPMRRTVTQLADSLGIDKAAVHRHLKTLEEGGFVKRYEDHGFVYYGLSWKARDLISPGENTRVIILLSATLMLLMAAVVFPLAATESALDGMVPRAPDSASEGDYASDDAASTGVSLAFIAGAVVFAIVGAYTLVRMVRTVRKPKQRALPQSEPQPSGCDSKAP